MIPIVCFGLGWFVCWFIVVMALITCCSGGLFADCYVVSC